MATKRIARASAPASPARRWCGTATTSLKPARPSLSVSTRSPTSRSASATLSPSSRSTVLSAVKHTSSSFCVTWPRVVSERASERVSE